MTERQEILSAERSRELESWIDNVIVPILVERILKERGDVRRECESKDLASDEDARSCSTLFTANSSAREIR